MKTNANTKIRQTVAHVSDYVVLFFKISRGWLAYQASAT
jgi:hypothetical protein